MSDDFDRLTEALRALGRAFLTAGLPQFLAGVWVGMVIMLATCLIAGVHS